MASTRKVTNETHRLKQYKMDYLMNTLKVLNHTITNDTSFYRQIGCAIVFDCIPIIKRKTSLLYEPTALGHNVTLLHRLVNELTITALSYVLKVYLSKWEYFEGYPVFNYCSYKLRINVDYGDADTDFLFQYCQYRLAHESDRHNSNNRIIRNSNQEMVIKNTYSVSNAYAIYVKNDALFGVNDWIVLQRIDIDFGAYTNLLVANLQLTDHLVTFKQKHDGKHGEYDLVTTNAKHRIYARSDLPTIRANVSLHTFHWYFEVHIIKKELGENVWIGFANSDFEPNDKRRIGVGCDVNSWASNGSTALHENNKMRTWRTEWVEGDVVGVCIDLKGTLDAEDRKFIKYYLNGHLIKDIKFTKLRKCDGVYPCISLDKGTAIDIVFDPVYFAQTMPSKFQHIRFSTKTIFHSSIHPKHHRDMLDARYCAKADEIQLNIEPNSVNDANVYEFTNTQFNFIVPFSNKLCRFSVYVQPNREAEYILLKTFDLRSNDDHPITYLLQMLKGNSDRIVDKKRFYQQIGFEMSSEWIPRIKRSTLAYQPTIMNQQTTVMRRIVQELGCNELEDLCNVCDMKFEMIAAHKAFNYSTFKMKANDNLSSQLSKCQYRMYMRQNDTVSDYKTSLELNYNDEIAIINRRHYVVEIKNQALFGFDTFMTLQTIYTKHEDYSNAFASSLRVQNDNQVILEHGSLPTVNHGVFDLIATASGYRVSNIRKYALLCAQTQLDSGKYYYEVHIKAIDVTSALNVRFGWSTTHFLSVGELNEKEKECGDGHHSWGWNGKTKHHGLQEDAKATIAAYGSQSAFIEDGDIIGCCIDIDLGQIRYYLDNQDLGVAFDNIRFEKAGVFPCVSYRKVSAESQFRNECAILDFEIVCEPQLFKCDAIPTGYSPIHCEDRNYLFTQSQKIQHQSEMLSSKYAVLHTETDSKQQLVDHSANIYQFDEIEHVQFIIPFIRKPANLGVYVQPKEGFKFMLIRKFRAKPIATLTTENQFYNEIGYLLTTLNHWKYQITNPSNFLQHVGVSLTENHADLLMQQAKSLSFPLIPLDAALTQRLVEELDIQCLSNYLKVLLSTFDVVGHAFDFCAIKMNPNPIYGDIDGSQLEWFERYQYKLRSNR
eukprot:336256_1